MCLAISVLGRGVPHIVSTCEDAGTSRVYHGCCQRPGSKLASRSPRPCKSASPRARPSRTTVGEIPRDRATWAMGRPGARGARRLTAARAWAALRRGLPPTSLAGDEVGPVPGVQEDRVPLQVAGHHVAGEAGGVKAGPAVQGQSVILAASVPRESIETTLRFHAGSLC